MRAILVAALMGLAAFGASAQQAPSEMAQPSGIAEVIDRQIDAFRDGDLVAAFGYASPAIRRQFRDPQTFGAMVERGYPMVWRPAEVRFLGTRPAGGGIVQRVMIRDAGGAFHLLEYLMVEGEGGWRIGGVRLLAAPLASRSGRAAA